MKRYLSVKEAATLLRVSTNTIYTYLKEGKITSRRIGRGRIKIPYNELAPFIEVNQPELHDDTVKTQPQPLIVHNGGHDSNGHTDELQHSVIEQEPITIEDSEPVSVHQQITLVPQNSNVDSIQELSDEEIIGGANDVVFYRIFKALSLIGLGFLYLVTSRPLFSYSGSVLEELGSILTSVLPFALLSVGVLNLAELLKAKEFEKSHLFIDIVTSIVLLVLVFLSVTTGHFGRAIFAASFALMSLGHVLKGALGEKERTFHSSFLSFTLYLAGFAGIVLVMYPGMFPIEFVANLINSYKGFFIFLWYLFIVSPFAYLISPFGRSSVLKLPFLLITGILSLIMATELTIALEWDLSFLVYITSVFILFLAWWGVAGLRIEKSKLNFLTLAFGWIALSLVFGLFALRASFHSLRENEQNGMDASLTQIVDKVNLNFDNQTAVLTSFAGSGDTANAIKEGDAEKAIEHAKTIYEKIENLERVLLYNSEGIAVGVYPRNSIAQGTNFSSREYFQKTKSSYKGQITPVFETVAGTKTVMQTEPVFEGNQMIGMIGVGLSLDTLRQFYESYTLPEYSLRAVDRNGAVVFETGIFSNDPLVRQTQAFSEYKSPEDILSSEQEAQIPNWKVYLQTDASILLGKNTDLNIVFSIILFVNAVFSMAVGAVLSTRRKLPGPDKSLPVTTIINPQVT